MTSAEKLLKKAVRDKHWAAAAFISGELANGEGTGRSSDLRHVTNKAVEEVIEIALSGKEWKYVFECTAELHRRQEVRKNGHKKQSW